MSPDLHIAIRASSAVMRRWRVANGVSKKKAAEMAGMSNGTWSALENLTTSPLSLLSIKQGRSIEDSFSPSAMKVAAMLKMLPEDIWTESVRAVRVPVLNCEVDAYALVDSVSRDPEDALHQREVFKRLEASLDTLTERSRRILTERYLHGKTLEEVAKSEGITSTRVREIECGALRKLRHPMRMGSDREARAYIEDKVST